MSSFREWYKSGEPHIWLTAGAIAASIIMTVGLLGLIAVRGLGYFWPHTVYQLDYRVDGKSQTLVGEFHDYENVPLQRVIDSGIKLESADSTITRYLVRVGNRDVYGVDFKTVVAPLIAEQTEPPEVMVLERVEYGNFYGFLTAVLENDQVVASGPQAWPVLLERIKRASQLRDEIRRIEKYEIGAINYRIERLRLRQRGLELEGKATPVALDEIAKERAEQEKKYQDLQGRLQALYADIRRDSLRAKVQDGREITLPLAKVLHAFQPNKMSTLDKVGFYFAKMGEFVSEDPREANTEGGIFPAIFGTVVMVFIMTIMVTPLGVIAAIYLREYAKQGPLVRLIRIAVNNLAGVPSIVYGVFGLGFFVYFVGPSIDSAFFPEALPAPTFGTPGIFWASLTLALMTLPVVIVSTEEGLTRIPRAIREGSLALGATKAETLWRTVIPMTSPAIMTGLILAIARAAGEVAPLMLVGVVKLAPSLPVDGNFPFIHLERKIMHLGFHIYDVGFQSPNVEAARPLVYATALLLVLVIVLLNLTAIFIRNRLREKYRALEH